SNPGVLSLVHGRLVRRVVGVFYLRLVSISKAPPTKCRSCRCAQPYLNASGIFSCHDRSGAAAGLRDPAVGKTREPVSARERSAACARGSAAVQLQLPPAGSRRTLWPA